MAVMIAEHRDRGNAGRAQHAGQRSRLLGLARVGEIPAQREDICLLDHLTEEGSKGGAVLRSAEVEVGHGGNPNASWGLGHGTQSRPRGGLER